MTDCLFCKIINQEISSEIIYEDDLVLAFNDKFPKAKIHILIIPKQHVANFNQITPEMHPDLIQMMTVAQKLAKEYNIDKTGYRLVINTNDDGGQEIHHLHLHLIGGQKLSRMA